MHSGPQHVMIFAAGFGTRMRPLTQDKPKPLIPVAGMCLLDRAISLAQDADKKVTVNGHYLADQIAQHLPEDISFIEELGEPLETGGGLKNALPKLGDGPVFTLNPDAVWKGPNPLRLLEAAWEPARMDALLMMIPQSSARGHNGGGDFALDLDGRLLRDKTGLIYSGAQILKTDLLRSHPKDIFSLNEIWQQMAARNRLCGVVYPGKWVDVGTPAGIGLAEDLLAESEDV